MNYEKLKQLEEKFLIRYPQGFESPELMAVSKKHKMDEMKNFVQTYFAKEKFVDAYAISTAFSQLISRSSLVSTFEKVKYKNVSKLFNQDDIETLSSAIWEMLYGDQQSGFNQLILLLSPFDIAKWPILTVLGLYYNGDYEVLVKPTTAKGVMNYLEVNDFKYTSKPNYAFYDQYRSLINTLKTQTANSLATDNGAYCGFLMMTIE